MGICGHGRSTLEVMVCDAVVDRATQVAEGGLKGMPVALAGVMCVTSREARDKGEVWAGAVGKVPKAADGSSEWSGLG